MIKSKGFFSIFVVTLLSGCTTHSIIKSDSSTDKPSCKLVNARAKMVDPERNALKDMIGNQAQGVGLEIKKLDSENLKIWIKLSPSTAKGVPLKKPGLILKLYKQGKMVQEYKLSGDLYDPIDAFISKNNSEVNDIWHDKAQIPAIVHGQKAIGFTISTEQFKKILETDLTKILVQTHYDPLTVFIEKDDFIPLKEFKNQCLS